MNRNKQAIDSNVVSKVFNRKRWTGQSLSKMKTPANIVKMEYLYVSQSAFTCSELTIETLEQGVK